MCARIRVCAHELAQECPLAFLCVRGCVAECATAERHRPLRRAVGSRRRRSARSERRAGREDERRCRRRGGNGLFGALSAPWNRLSAPLAAVIRTLARSYATSETGTVHGDAAISFPPTRTRTVTSPPGRASVYETLNVPSAISVTVGVTCACVCVSARARVCACARVCVLRTSLCTGHRYLFRQAQPARSAATSRCYRRRRRRQRLVELIHGEEVARERHLRHDVRRHDLVVDSHKLWRPLLRVCDQLLLQRGPGPTEGSTRYPVPHRVPYPVPYRVPYPVPEVPCGPLQRPRRSARLPVRTRVPLPWSRA